MWGTNIVLQTTGSILLFVPYWAFAEPEVVTLYLRRIYRNGRWRSEYIYNQSNSTLTGTIQVDVHYYEDGNVRLVTKKPVTETLRSGSSTEIAKVIGTVEKKYQEELNRAFNTLSEGAFKSLRRQLPVMRQKVNWDQITGYRVCKT